MKNIFAVFFFLCTACAFAAPLNKIVVFGDSLSDNGNLYEYMKHQFPQDPPYYKGRFSNGPVWVELLADFYYPKQGDAHLLNYAFGGAGVLDDADVDPTSDLMTLDREIDSYLLAHQDKTDARSLYVVWIGSNNYLGMPEEKEKTLNMVLNGINKGLRRLAEKGAKHVVVINIPDLGKTPAADDDVTAELLSYYSDEHNRRLNENVVKLQKQYPGVQWLYVDIYEIFHDALINPEKYGFLPQTVHNTCFDVEETIKSSKAMLSHVVKLKPGFAAKENPCDGYLFFDPVHPTTAAHLIMANLSKEILDAAGVEFE